MKTEDLKNIQTFLKIGKFELSAEAAVILAATYTTVTAEIKKLETPKEEVKE